MVLTYSILRMIIVGGKDSKSNIIFFGKYSISVGYAVVQSVEALHYKLQVVGLIPDGVIGIFH
jgi:hypothetical protein